MVYFMIVILCIVAFISCIFYIKYFTTFFRQLVLDFIVICAMLIITIINKFPINSFIYFSIYLIWTLMSIAIKIFYIKLSILIQNIVLKKMGLLPLSYDEQKEEKDSSYLLACRMSNYAIKVAIIVLYTTTLFQII